MIDTHRILEFLIAVIAISVAPGPDTVYVLSRSLSQGRFAGLMASAGSAAGVMGHITLSVLGVSALIAASPTGFLVLKIAGTCYLIYLGIRMMRQSGTVIGAYEFPQDKPHVVWVQGIFTNILNPKVVIFFLAFIPQFIDPRLGHIPLQFLLLGFTLNLIGTAWLCIVAMSSSALKTWLHSHPFATRWQQRITGAIFIAFAAKLVFR
jgi:threonine/homoserine/homoserine lactone efflux protein